MYNKCMTFVKIIQMSYICHTNVIIKKLYYKCNTNVIHWQFSYILMLFQFHANHAAALIELYNVIILSLLQFQKQIRYQLQ